MRALKAASVAIALSMSGPLALGSAGDAFASPSSGAAAPATAPGDTETTQAQFLVIERLGQLTELTGALGRFARDKTAGPLLLGLRERLHSQAGLVEQAVRQVRKARQDKTLPAPGSGSGGTSSSSGSEKRRPLPSERTVTLGVATKGFLTAVDGVIHVDRTNPLARTATSNALIRHLAQVDAAAMREAGMPQRSQGQQLLGSRGALADGREHRLTHAHKVTYTVGRLVRDVLEAPGGRLSRKQLAEHNSRIADAFSTSPGHAKTLPAPAGDEPEKPKTLPAPVDSHGRDLDRGTKAHGTNARRAQQRWAVAAADLHARAGALLKTAAGHSSAGTRSAATGALTGSAAQYVMTLADDGRP